MSTLKQLLSYQQCNQLIETHYEASFLTKDRTAIKLSSLFRNHVNGP